MQLKRLAEEEEQEKQQREQEDNKRSKSKGKKEKKKAKSKAQNPMEQLNELRNWIDEQLQKTEQSVD